MKLWYNYIRESLDLFFRMEWQVINIVKKIYIITGANGFLGNNIIRKLEQDADNEIRAFVLKGDSIKSLEGLKCKIYYGDVTKKETLSLIFENTDGKEVFVHFSQIVCEGYKTLDDGQAVSYEVKEGERGLQATNVNKL